VFATLGAIGFGFVTWYFWLRREPSHAKPPRVSASLERSASQTTTVSQVIETRSTVLQKTMKEEESVYVETVKTSKDEEKIESSVVSQVLLTEEVQIEAAPVEPGSVNDLNVDNLNVDNLNDLNDLNVDNLNDLTVDNLNVDNLKDLNVDNLKDLNVDNLKDLNVDNLNVDNLNDLNDLNADNLNVDNLAIPDDLNADNLNAENLNLPTEKEEVFAFPQKKGKKAKGTFRPSAMDLFAAPVEEKKTEPSNYVLEKTTGGLTFT
jgi:hypothetical protein